MKQKTKFKQADIELIPEDWVVKKLGDNLVGLNYNSISKKIRLERIN